MRERMLRNALGSVSLLNVVLCLIVVIVIAALMFPLFQPHRYGTPISRCQSNLKQIGNAFKMYLTDNNDTYPTNRAYSVGEKLGPIRAHVKLTPAGEPADKHGNPRIYKYGPNWVESLTGYIEQATKARDPMAVWKCPACSNSAFPESSRETAATSYTFNRNMVEKPEKIIKSASNLMLVRDADRLLDADLRPTNDSNGNPDRVPISPFLTTRDARMGRTDPQLHSSGSNMLFADGHVKTYDVRYFPEQDKITKANCWDPKTRQWVPTFGPGARVSPELERSIAITP